MLTTQLNPGDIAFTYVGLNRNIQLSEFSFVTLRNITAGTILSFTDFGYSANQNGFLTGNFNNEGIILIRFGNIPCGTEVLVRKSNNGVEVIPNTPGGVGASLEGFSGNFTFANSNDDQIFAFQGNINVPNPRLVAGAMMAQWGSGNGDSFSDRSPLLANFGADVQFGPTDNNRYRCNTRTVGNRSELLTALTNPNNYDRTDDYIGSQFCQFLCCPLFQDLYQNLSLDRDQVCPNQTVIATVTGSYTARPIRYNIYSGGCFGDFVTSVTGTGGFQVQLNPSVTTTYFVYATPDNLNGCQTPNECINFTINVDAPLPEARCRDGLIVDLDQNGAPIFQASDLDNGSTVSCGGQPIFIDVSNVAGAGCGNASNFFTVQLGVQDQFGRQAFCESTIVIRDATPPQVFCQNIAVDLGPDGTFNTAENAAALTDNLIAAYTDNCTPLSAATINGQLSYDCSDAGLNREVFTFQDASGNTSVCRVSVQVNDPNKTCGGAPTVNCTALTSETAADGSYALNANELDRGSSDDELVYSLTFSDVSVREGATNLAGEILGALISPGQAFTAPLTGAIQAIEVRADAPTRRTRLFIYDGDNGSGVTDSIGTPAYTQSEVEIYAGTSSGRTRILLSEPFPVEIGRSYTFVFEEDVRTFLSNNPDGGLVAQYAIQVDDVSLDYAIHYIGPTVDTIDAAGIYPVTLYAVDNYGNVSQDNCQTTFTLKGALPVEWLSFEATAAVKHVDLHWQTTLEEDNAGFTLERSSDGRDWTIVEQIPPTTLPDQQYTYQDDQPTPGNNYYRIRQTDYDGASTLSPVRQVRWSDATELRISPNPTHGRFTVRSTAPIQITGVYTLTGRQLDVALPSGASGGEIDLSGRPAGVYLLRALRADGSSNVRRIIVR